MQSDPRNKTVLSWWPMAVLIALLIPAGCEEDRFEIEMKPKGKVLHRKLIWEHSGKKETESVFRVEKLTQLRAYYPKHSISPDGKKQVYTGQFTGKTPHDVGGSGWYLHFQTRMGTLGIYSERFGRHDDLAGPLADRLRAMDLLVDLLIEWFRAELARDPNFETLHAFMDVKLRTDLKNFNLYLWLGSVVEKYKKNATEDMLVRFCLYLADRDYFDPEKLPALSAAIEQMNQGKSRKLFTFVQRLVADKMGVPGDKPIPESLTFLSDTDPIQKSLKRYWADAPVKGRVTAWLKKKKAGKEVETPLTAETALLELTGLDFEIFGDSVKVVPRIACPVKPFATNGKWDTKTGNVGWSGTLRKRGNLPVFCYAFWAEPNEAFQRSAFGRILLREKLLAEYVMWRKGIAPASAEQWDRFLTDLKPGKDLKSRIENFQFPDDTPTRLLLQALKASDNKSK